jgi:hypothetical protein
MSVTTMRAKLRQGWSFFSEGDVFAVVAIAALPY